MSGNKKKCPCGSGQEYKACCKPFHKGEKLPPTAEKLMRSRFSAYAKNLTSYLQETWHPSTRPSRIHPDLSLQWLSLQVVSVSQGSAKDKKGTVTFTARYLNNGIPGTMTETSDFVKEGGRWLYIQGTTS